MSEFWVTNGDRTILIEVKGVAGTTSDEAQALGEFLKDNALYGAATMGRAHVELTCLRDRQAMNVREARHLEDRIREVEGAVPEEA